MNLYFATRDGQSEKIASRIAQHLAAKGISAPPRDLAKGTPTAADLPPDEPLIIVASVRYGRHLPEADRFAASLARLAAPPPLVLISVNLTARKAGKTTAEGNAYLRKWINRHQLKPTLALAIAGRLDYPRYGLLDRLMIQLIMKMTGGPTDPTSVVEYTPWDVLEDFAGKIAALKAR